MSRYSFWIAVVAICTSSLTTSLRATAGIDKVLRINEFVANNTGTGLVDEDGDRPDWIEIYNPDPGAVNLDGYYLSDDATDLTKWRLPSVSIPADGFLVVFASGKNRAVAGSELHTSFQLDAEGEYLALVASDGKTVVSECAPMYPEQEPNFSYGVFGSPPSIGYMPTITPGAPNSAAGALLGFVADTTFTPKRGFYDTAQSVAITTVTPNVQIYYTTDGSQPTTANGTLYSGPVSVNTTTVLRAAAFRDGWKPTNVDSHSYIFVDDVASQPNNPAGFPSSWRGTGADYEMDPQITGNPAWSGQIRDSLLSLPTISISCLTSDLFGSNGIYANPTSHGIAWERVCSAEWIESDNSSKFQVDCGLRIQGGFFRQANVTQKHSFRFLFKDEYGPGKLRTPLFDEPTATETFDTLVLRAGANDGYAWGGAGSTVQFTRDQFGRQLHIDMGHASSHGRFVHLYLNGLYWGLYNIVERPNEDHGAEYYGGGEAADWDSNNAGEYKNGDATAWNTFNSLTAAANSTADYFELKGLDASGVRDSALPVYLDSAQYIDYMIGNIWGGNWDWPNKNFWFGRDRTAASDGFKFYMWDFENTMGNNRGRSPVNMVAPRSGIEGSWVGGPHDDLKDQLEYQREFGDHVQKHFFDGGLLTTANLIQRYRDLADSIELAVIAETARWGDDNREPAYTLNEWRSERDWILNTYLPQRSGIVLQQFKGSGLYPGVEAPVFNQAGGNVPDDFVLVITDPNTQEGMIYYTTDGTDPRLPSLPPKGGGPVEHTLVQEADAKRVRVPTSQLDGGSFVNNGGIQPAWAEEGFDDGGWSAGTGGVGYENSSGYQAWFDINVGPQMSGQRTSCLIRVPFNVSAPQLADIDQLLLSIRYDDAYVAYVNGVEIARTSNAPGTMDGNSGASGTHSDGDAVTLVDAPLFTVDSATKAPLVEGANVLAIHGLNNGTGSSDFLMSPMLVGTEMVDQGTPQISPNAVAYTSTLTLTESQRLRARFLSDTGIWSALADAAFIVGTVPASASNLVVSEFHYHPAEPVDAAEIAISTDRDDYEFVELLNIGGAPVDLTGVRFSDGINFAFPDAAEIPVGGRVVLVANQEAFEERYSDKLGSMTIGGDYGARLGNGGEIVSLLAADDSVIKQFAYSDVPPWPAVADGGGPSLVLLDPAANPDHSDAANWGVSTDADGCPGGATPVAGGFTGDPDADEDFDGLSALLEYALGTLDSSGSSGKGVIALSVESFSPGGVADDYATFRYQRSRSATDVVFAAEVSDDLVNWSDGPGEIVEESVVDNGDGTETVTVRPATPFDTTRRQYFRLKVAI